MKVTSSDGVRSEVGSKIKTYADILLKGGVATMAPDVLRGALVEMLKAKKVNVKRASEWVEGDVSLWETLEPEHRNSLLKLGQYIKNVNWLTADFVIDAIRHDLPAVASLFLGWKKGKNWLERQATQIRQEISS